MRQLFRVGRRPPALSLSLSLSLSFFFLLRPPLHRARHLVAPVLPRFQPFLGRNEFKVSVGGGGGAGSADWVWVGGWLRKACRQKRKEDDADGVAAASKMPIGFRCCTSTYTLNVLAQPS
jgi:hypothetical protein